MSPRVVIISTSPAGLTAAYELVTRYGITSTVLEADDDVGGISRTVERDGWRFDIGGHRFFTKVKEVEALWHEILPREEFLLRPRMSRIYYNGKYYDYPLKASNALRNLGACEALLSVGSYLWARLRPPKDQTTLEGWIAARFGWRLYEHFFKTYNEKLWGVPVSSLPADFAAQRIKNLSLVNAVDERADAEAQPKGHHLSDRGVRVPETRSRDDVGACRDLIEARGCRVEMQTRVLEIRQEEGRAVAVVAEGPDGTQTEHPCDHVVSSMPLSHLFQAMRPAASPEALDGGRRSALPRFPHGRARRT